MDRVAGQIPSDTPPHAASGWLADATPQQQRRAWTSGIHALAHVHTTPLADLKLPPELLRTAPDPLAAEVERYARFLAWAEDDKPFDLARNALDWLRHNQPPAPPEGPTPCWGDARLSNLIFQDFEVAAVLDWEMASVCDRSSTSAGGPSPTRPSAPAAACGSP
jgi:aminoglycoside phosphotransferase (APT) family kinase protein